MKLVNLSILGMSVALTAGMLAGCGSHTTTGGTTSSVSSVAEKAESPTNSRSGKESSKGKTEITVWHYFSTEGSANHFQEYVDEFNNQSDTTHVNVTVLPFADFKKQLTVSASASALPDLAMIDNCDTVSYAAMGILEDITSEVQNWDSYKNYFPEILNTCKYEGKVYGMPMESNNLEIIYNKDIFDELGVDYPTDDWTFDDLKELAKKTTTDKYKGFAISGVQSEESTYQFLPFFWTAGGETMKLDSESGNTALSLWTELMNNGYMPKDCISWTQSELASQFESGNIAMHVMGCWNITPYKDHNINYGVVEIPSATEGGKKATVYGGENLCVIKGKNTANALEFLKWFEEYDRISKWDKLIDHFTASEKSMKDESFQTPEMKPFIDMVPNSRARDVVTYWPSVSEGYQQAIQEALSGQQDVESALKDGQKMIDDAIASAS